MKKLLALLLLAASLQAPAKTIQWSGYTWTIKNGNKLGPGPNNWSDAPESVFVDKEGALHLTIRKTNNVWYSSEIWLEKSLGYGKYEFEILTAPQSLDRNLVASPFLYENDSKELDIEYSYWGSTAPAPQNTNLTTQPYVTPGNSVYFSGIYAPPFQAVIDWRADKILYANFQNGVVINAWTYQGSDNFLPGNERLHLNFWQCCGVLLKGKETREFVFKSFKFTK